MWVVISGIDGFLFFDDMEHHFRFHLSLFFALLLPIFCERVLALFRVWMIRLASSPVAFRPVHASQPTSLRPTLF